MSKKHYVKQSQITAVTIPNTGMLDHSLVLILV